MSAAPTRTDAELLQAAPYDVAAFEAVYRAHFRRVVGFAADLPSDGASHNANCPV